MAVIFLNGAGSSGKSSVAKAIQRLSDKPWLIIGIDSFITMMPDNYVGFNQKSKEGFEFIAREENGKPAVAIKSGPYGQKIVETIPKLVKLLADQKLDLIIDEILFDKEALKNYAKELTNIVVYFVGVECSLESMEEREILRGDRAIGLSRDQYFKVHKGIKIYDLKVDTTEKSSFICAKEILNFIDNNPDPVGFSDLRKGM